MSLRKKELVRYAIYGLECWGIILCLFVIVVSMIPVHAQPIGGVIGESFEHRVTLTEAQIQQLVQQQAECRQIIADVQSKIVYMIAGISLLLIKALVNIFMGTWFPQAKPVKD